MKKSIGLACVIACVIKFGNTTPVITGALILSGIMILIPWLAYEDTAK